LKLAALNHKESSGVIVSLLYRNVKQ